MVGVASLRLDLPDNIKAVDAGLGAPHFIFTLLDPDVTRKLIVIDTVNFGGKPGDLVRLNVEDLPPGSYRDAHSWGSHRTAPPVESPSYEALNANNSSN